MGGGVRRDPAPSPYRLVLAQELKRHPEPVIYMILAPRFTDDVADLPTHEFGPKSLTWWGIIGFLLIEGTFFALAFAAYFFLMGHEQAGRPKAARRRTSSPGRCSRSSSC